MTRSPRSRPRPLAGLLLALGLLAPAALPARQAPPLPPPGPEVAFQDHRDWEFPGDGVRFDNRAEGSRLNAVVRTGRDRYELWVLPENVPINPSPWYGFRVQAPAGTALHLRLRYVDGQPRYSPWLSDDGEHWRDAGAAYTVPGHGLPELVLQGTGQPQWVFAQPPVTLAAMQAWAGRLAARVPLQAETIGQSRQGRPLTMLQFGNPQARGVVLVLGRQHPPETTGAHAMMAFVDALAADTPAARRFRQDYRVVVVPVVNPDGVAEGHWRGNAAGTDLNRDWGTFRQPETRAIRDALGRAVSQRGGHMVFVLDFHSTWHDVLYTVKEDPSRRPGGLMQRWIAGLQQRYPGRIRESAASAADSPVFKNWAFRSFGAPVATYEVGDGTTREDLDGLARFAADELVSLLPPADAAADPAPRRAAN
jgi:hypothetical protein